MKDGMTSAVYDHRPACKGLQLFLYAFSFFLLALMLRSTATYAVSIDSHLVTDDPKAGTGCTTPTAKSSFSPTDAKVYSWALVSGGFFTDSISWKWYAPDNSLYNATDPLALSVGSSCAYSWIGINGYTAANKTGKWKVEVYLDNVLTVSDTFTIGTAECAYTYSAWGACQPDGTQTRTVISSSPNGCAGTPVLSQKCTASQLQCAYTYSDWQPCRTNGTQTRTVTSTTPSGCAGTPMLSQPCSFTPSAPQYMGFLLEGTMLSVAWKSVAGATGYKMGIGGSSGTYLGPYDIGNITQIGPVDIAGVAGGTYYLAVKAYTGGNESAYSKEIAVTVPGIKAPGRTDSGSISFRSNRSSYAPGNRLDLSFVTEKGTLQGNVDIYVAVGVPTGQPVGGGSFSGAIPLLRDVAVTDTTITLFSGPFPVDIPFGTYALSIVLVYPGMDPRDPRNWASPASQLTFSYSVLSDVQKEIIKSRGNPDYLATAWVKEAQQKTDSWTYLSGNPSRFGFLNGDIVSQETVAGNSGVATPKLDPALFNPQTTPEQLKAAFGQPVSSSVIEGMSGSQMLHYAAGIDVIFVNGKFAFALTSTP